MNKGHIYFEIQADDTGRAADFYSRIFGWKFIEMRGLPISYWQIDAEGSWGGLLKRPANTPPPQCGTNAFICSFEVKTFSETEK